MKYYGKWNILHISLICIFSLYFASKVLPKKKKKPLNSLKRKKLTRNDNLIKKNPLIKLPENQFFYVICFTGGPCAGKSSAINYISNKLSQKGINVLKIEETPTLTVKGGGSINIGSFKKSDSYDFFSTYIYFQIEIENIYREIAKYISERPTVMLCDRGVNDAFAYMSGDMREFIKNQYDLNIQGILNTRYDCCIHMVTAADGAEKYYNLSTNVARHENADKANKIDKLVQKAYLSHQNFHIINNECLNFEEKMENAYLCIEKQIFNDFKKTNYRYLIEMNDFPTDLQMTKMAITQHNLKSIDEFIKRTLKQVKFNSFTMYLYTRNNTKNNLKYRNQINLKEFNILLKENECVEEIHKTKIKFIYENQILLVQSDDLNKNHTYLKVEKISLFEEIKIPPYIKILEEIK